MGRLWRGLAWLRRKRRRRFGATGFGRGDGEEQQPLVPGRYSVGETAKVVDAEYFDEDDHCTPSPAMSATSGTIDLTRADSSFEGTFDVTFPTGHMVGSFDAPSCDDPTRYAGMADAGAACVSYPACGAGSSGVRPCTS